MSFDISNIGIQQLSATGDSFVVAEQDEHGRPVERTKGKYPYSYDGYVLWRKFPQSEVQSTVYSDRLSQWDQAKTERLWEQHCAGHNYTNVPSDNLQAFLRNRLDDQKIVICLLMEYCNVSNGYPCWRIDYKREP